jgi:tetratricopeptide (TPR) repeat protein
MSPKHARGFHRTILAFSLVAGLLGLAQAADAADGSFGVDDQAPGDAFASRIYFSPDSNFVNHRPRRLKPEPPLKVEWKKTPSRMETFDGSLGGSVRNYSRDPFINPLNAINPSDEYFAEEDPFAKAALGHHWGRTVPDPFGGADDTSEVERPTLKGATSFISVPEVTATAPPWLASAGANAVPVLTASTNGTVSSRNYGVSSSLAGTNIVGWNTARLKGRLTKNNRATKVSAVGSVKPRTTNVNTLLAETLHDIWKIECEFQPFGLLPSFAQKTKLKDLYTSASRLESHPVMKTFYLFMSHMAIEDYENSWRAVEIAIKQSPDNKELFESFADEFDYQGRYFDADILRDSDLRNAPLQVVRVHYEKGIKAVRAHNWELAWKELEQIYVIAPNADQFVKKIALEFRLEKNDIATSVWLTRLMKNAKDWDTFNSASCERSGLELRAYEKFLETEPKTIGHWHSNRMPLKVCFPSETDNQGELWTSDQETQLVMLEALDDWMTVCSGRLDYEIVNDAKQADIVCVSGMHRNSYADYLSPLGLKEIPLKLKSPTPAAETFTKRKGDEIQSARIVFYDNGSERNASALKEVSLHEVGHALGLLHHSKDSADLMYGIKFGIDKRLTANDRARMWALYKDYPLNKLAVEKYCGLEAVCLKFGDPVELFPAVIDTAPDMEIFNGSHGKLNFVEP